MSEKSKRIWLIVLLVPLIIFFGLILTLKLYFSSERLKSFVIPKIEETTNRKVEISDISLSIFPTIGVNIENFMISAQKSEEFEKKEYVSLKRLILDVKIIPLFSHRLEINKVILDEPDIYLEINAEGIPNYGIDGRNIGDEKNFEVKTETTWKGSISLANFQINRGKLEFVDKKDNTRMLINNFNQRSRVSTLTGTNNVNFISEFEIDGISYGSVSSYFVEHLPLKGVQTSTYYPATDELVFDSVKASMKEIKMSMTGKITNTQNVPDFDLVITSEDSEFSHMLSLAPETLIKPGQDLKSEGKFNFKMKIVGEFDDNKMPVATGEFGLVNGTIKYAELPKSITNIKLTGSFEKTDREESFSIEHFGFNIGNNPIAGNLAVSNFDDPSISLKASGTLNLGEVKDFYPLEKGTELSGTVFGNVSVSGKANIPSEVKADGRIVLKNLFIKIPDSQRAITNLSGHIIFNNHLIDSKDMFMNIGESDLKIKFTLKNYLSIVLKDDKNLAKPSALITLTSNQLRTADLISDREKESKGKEEKPASMILPGIDIKANVNIDKFVTEKFEFSNASGSVGISNAIVELQNFSVDIFRGNITTQGTLDLREPGSRPFDFKLDIVGVEANFMLTKFTSFGNNLFGKFSMTTNLKGSLDDTLGLNQNSLLGNGNVQIHDGRFVGYPVMASIAGFTGIDELRQVDFQSWKNSFTITDGRILIKDLIISAGNTDFNVNGAQSFDGTLDYSVAIKLPQELSQKLKVGGTAGQLLNTFKDKEGKLTVNLLVSGNTSKPAVGIDARGQQRQIEEAAGREIDKRKSELESKIREETKKLEDSVKQKGVEELKKKGEDALKKLFKRP